VWEAEEYTKLLRYDGDTVDQSPALFLCHQADGYVCSGWLAHAEHPSRFLAVRLAAMADRLDESCLDYTTDVPLFRSGREAAQHGLAGVDRPDEDAQQVIRKVQRKRQVTS
jgi:hypothetical protein